jgi:glycyl-tRNA synthetase
MSDALYELGGLRFWSEDEIELREAFQSRAVSVVRRTLLAMNPAWSFIRAEGPCLAPRSKIGPAYSDDDVFVTNHIAGGEALCLRAETTPSSYAVARASRRKLPLCVWQAGKSFRRETNDGASASKLRFNEFWQLEFQCIYAEGTKADYRAALIPAIEREIGRFTQEMTRVVESERLPAYSSSTLDIEAVGVGGWREMASCSIRTDYSPDARVCEIAIGLDRVATLAALDTQEKRDG